METDIALNRSKLTTPRVAAIAGIIFSVLLLISLVLIRISVPSDPQEAGTWLSGDWKNVNLALNSTAICGYRFLVVHRCGA